MVRKIYCNPAICSRHCVAGDIKECSVTLVVPEWCEVRHLHALCDAVPTRQPRRSGKSTKIIAKAQEARAQGNNVIIFYPTFQMAKLAFNGSRCVLHESSFRSLGELEKLRGIERGAVIFTDEVTPEDYMSHLCRWVLHCGHRFALGYYSS